MPEAKTAAQQVADTIFSVCRPLTVPLKIGLTNDLRVCQPFISEAIAEAARVSVDEEELNEPLQREIEVIKSLIINNY